MAHAFYHNELVYNGNKAFDSHVLLNAWFVQLCQQSLVGISGSI